MNAGTLNTTLLLTNPALAYGNNINFVELLFRQVLEHGWEGISVLFIIQLYFYLSLDKIKDMF